MLHLERHLDLLGARLVARVHAPCNAVCRKRLLHLLVFVEEQRDLVRVVLGVQPLELGALAACDAQREAHTRLCAGRLGKQLAQRPVRLGRELRDEAGEARGHALERRDEDAPERGERLGVVGCAVGRWMRAKGGSEVHEPVALQTRQQNLGQRERVDPCAGKRSRLGAPHDEAAIERRVVRDEVAPSRELRERRHGLPRRWGVCDVGVRDAGELGDLFGDGAPGVHEGLEALHDIGAVHAQCRNLDERAVRGVEPRGLGIDDYNVVFYERKRRVVGGFGKRMVACADILVRARDEQRVERGAWLCLFVCV